MSSETKSETRGSIMVFDAPMDGYRITDQGGWEPVSIVGYDQQRGVMCADRGVTAKDVFAAANDGKKKVATFLDPTKVFGQFRERLPESDMFIVRRGMPRPYIQPVVLMDLYGETAFIRYLDRHILGGMTDQETPGDSEVEVVRHTATPTDHSSDGSKSNFKADFWKLRVPPGAWRVETISTRELFNTKLDAQRELVLWLSKNESQFTAETVKARRELDTLQSMAEGQF